MIPSQLYTWLTALGAAALLTPLVMLVMSRMGVVDRPDGQRKLHRQPVPLAGGLAIWLATLAAVWASRSFTDIELSGAEIRFWISFILASGLLCAVGLADDIWNIRARHKLIGQILAVGVLVIGSDLVVRSIELFGWHLELGILSIPFTMFWLLGAINAMNLLDGMDGLAATVGAMIGVALAVMAAIGGNLAESTVAAALVGSLFGFLIYNFPPAKVYLGDTGSMLIGLVLGVVAVRAALKGPATVALAAPVAIWTLPILDASMAILRRKLTGRSICIPDRGHLHHRLSDRGLSTRKALLLIASLSAMTTAGAIASMVFRAEWIAPTVAIGVTAFLAGTRLFGHSEFALLARRLRIFANSMAPFRKLDTAGHEHRSRLQGTREWDQLWESLITFAEGCRLDSVQLSVSLPRIHEEFFAGWHRRLSLETGRTYRAEIPLASPVFGSIGVLRIAGQCPDDSACVWIGDLIEGLRPFEVQIAELLASEAAEEAGTVDIPLAAPAKVAKSSAKAGRAASPRRKAPIALLAGPVGGGLSAADSPLM